MNNMEAATPQGQRPPGSTQTAPPRPGMLGGMCLNWKVIGFLAMVGTGIWFGAPNLRVAVIPFLPLLLCPLTMGAMMWAMRGKQAAQPGSEPDGPEFAGASRDSMA